MPVVHEVKIVGGFERVFDIVGFCQAGFVKPSAIRSDRVGLIGAFKATMARVMLPHQQLFIGSATYRDAKYTRHYARWQKQA